MNLINYSLLTCLGQPNSLRIFYKKLKMNYLNQKLTLDIKYIGLFICAQKT